MCVCVCVHELTCISLYEHMGCVCVLLVSVLCAVKEQKKGDLFPEYTLMSRGTRLSPLCFLTEHLYQDAAHISAVMVVFIRQVAL